MKQNTKQKLIEAGAQIIHRNGYNNTGIQEILKAVGVPKGSFYFYFKSKDDFGLQIIDFYDNMYMNMINPVITDENTSPVEKISSILEYFINFFDEIECSCGCPIGNLSQEMGDLNTEFKQRLEKSLAMISGVYHDLLSDGKETNEISHDVNLKELSEFIVSSWHGALIRMKIEKSVMPLRVHKKFILGIITG